MTKEDLIEYVLCELAKIRKGIEADRFTLENIRELEKNLIKLPIHYLQTVQT